LQLSREELRPSTHRWAGKYAVLLELAIAEAQVQPISILLQGDGCDAGRAAVVLMDFAQMEGGPPIMRALIDHEPSSLLLLSWLLDGVAKKFHRFLGGYMSR